MADYGTNLAQEAVNLFQLHETAVYNKIDRKNKQVDELVSKMEDLEKFLALVSDKLSGEETSRLDLLENEQMQIVDQLREKYPDLAHIFPHGKYSWKEGELDNLKRQINQHIEGPLQRKITMANEEILLEQHELTKALEIFRSMLTRVNNQIDRILTNIQRAH